MLFCWPATKSPAIFRAASLAPVRSPLSFVMPTMPIVAPWMAISAMWLGVASIIVFIRMPSHMPARSIAGSGAGCAPASYSARSAARSKD